MSVYRHDPCNFGFAQEWGTSVVVTNNSTNIFFLLNYYNKIIRNNIIMGYMFC